MLWSTINPGYKELIQEFVRAIQDFYELINQRKFVSASQYMETQIFTDFTYQCHHILSAFGRVKLFDLAMNVELENGMICGKGYMVWQDQHKTLYQLDEEWALNHHRWFKINPLNCHHVQVFGK